MELCEELEELSELNDFEGVRELLASNPDFDVNSLLFHKCSTLLCRACSNGFSELVSVLLGVQGIDVNRPNRSGWTPLSTACWRERTECVKLLLRDPRVEVNPPARSWHPAIFEAAFSGNVNVIKWMIALRGEELSAECKGRCTDGYECTAIEVARHFQNTEIVSLLEGFLENRENTIQQVRAELGETDVHAAKVFATIVFLCDGFFALRELDGPESQQSRNARKFLLITQRLPMEIQMSVANKTAGSSKQFVLTARSEPEFKKLARD